MQSQTPSARPLSPHLQVYRWRYTMALSILHRATGLMLSLGLVLLVAWLLGIANGAASYDCVMAAFTHPLMRIVFVGYSFAFFYHLANGIRHLVWDTGRGLERKSARASARVVVVAAVVCTILFWIVVCVRYSGSVA